jgi:hypothetical protein
LLLQEVLLIFPDCHFLVQDVSGGAHTDFGAAHTYFGSCYTLFRVVIDDYNNVGGSLLRLLVNIFVFGEMGQNFISLLGEVQTQEVLVYNLNLIQER